MLQATLQGLAQGASYAQLALAFTLVFGVLRRIDLAHGASVMLGLYGALWLQRAGGWSPWVIAPLALVVALVAGSYVERVCFAPHRRGAAVTAMAASFAVWMQLEEAATLLLPRHVYAFPMPFDDGPVVVAGLRPVQWASIAMAALTCLVLAGVLHRTRFGLALRAVVQDRDAAAGLGVHLPRMAWCVFALASCVGAVAGYSIVSIDGQITPMLAMWMTLKGLTAAMLGGLGSLGGAVAGGLALGLLESHAQAACGPQCRDLTSHAVLIGVLAAGPLGLAGLLQRWLSLRLAQAGGDR